MKIELISVFLKRIKGKYCFKQLKGKYPVKVVKALDKIINARWNIVREQEQVKFYRACIATSWLPHQFTKQLW